MQIVIRILIGWDHESNRGESGIFGIPQAYADCCEEQARYTLHSHITVWVKDFNDTRNLLFHEDQIVREKAKGELEKYFEMIAQASLGPLYELHNNTLQNKPTMRNINDVLKPPDDQVLRNMRHHVHCLDLHGIVGSYYEEESIDKNNSEKDGLDTGDIIRKNTNVYLGPENVLDDINNHQLDVLAYTYPFHMKDCNLMKPKDCQSLNDIRPNSLSLETAIKLFNLRHPLLQLRFNIHDCYHRPSCFKKGPECRTELPQKHTQIACIQFDEDNSINWYFIDGSVKKVIPFKYVPKRNIGDQFMNINNDIAVIIQCNNNVIIGNKA